MQLPHSLLITAVLIKGLHGEPIAMILFLGAGTMQKWPVLLIFWRTCYHQLWCLNILILKLEADSSSKERVREFTSTQQQHRRTRSTSAFALKISAE